MGKKQMYEDDTSSVRKKWIRCSEGIEIYRISRPKLIELARDAGAAVKINSVILIDRDAFDNYLETFRIPGNNGQMKN